MFGERNTFRVWPLVAALSLAAGCPARLTTGDLPLSGARLEALRREIAARGPGADPDRGWIELLHGGGTPRPAALFGAAVDPLSALGRALSASGQGRDSAAIRAWGDLLRACRKKAGEPCSTLRLLALGELAAVGGERAGWLPRVIDALLLSAVAPEVRDRAEALRARILRRAGRQADLNASFRRRGCPPAWRVSGPSGRNPRLDLGRPHPGRPGRTVSAYGCRLEIRTGTRWGGVLLAETEVTAPAAAAAVLTVETAAPWQLLVDGAVAWTEGKRGRRGARLTRLSLIWPAGRRRLGIKVGSASSYVSVSASLAPAAAGPNLFRFAAPSTRLDRAEATAPRAGRIPCAGRPERLMARARWPVWYWPLASYLTATRALGCGDLDRAHDLVDRSTRLAPRFAAPRLLRLRALAADTSLPRVVITDRRRRILQELLRSDPTLGDARFQLAELLLEAGQATRAQRLFSAGAREWPGEARWHVGLQKVFRERSYLLEEERAVQRALALAPGRCDLLEDLVGLRRNRKAVAGLGGLVDRTRRCDAASGARATFLRDSGNQRQALTEYRRLAALRPDAAHLRREVAQLQQQLGERREAMKTLAALRAEYPGAAPDLIKQADLLAAAGDRPGAVKMLRRAYRRWPWQGELRRALQQLTRQSVMQRFRRSGAAVIARYRRSARTSRAPAVMVQDRTVMRLLPGGASVILAHNIVQVLTKKGMERWGEVRLPRGAVVLTLRAVKQDGTTSEPEEGIAAGKESTSIPGLAVGDFVEVEYLQESPPSRAFAGAAGERFFFSSFEVPIVSSEYTVVAPRGLALQIVEVGGAPGGVREIKDGLQVIRWRRRDVARRIPEPRSAPASEYLPSVRVAVGASWERWRDHFREQLMAATRSTRLLRLLARRITAGRRTREEKARAIYAWVMAHVEAAGARIGDASRAVAGGAGSRYTTMLALLNTVGIPAELWLVRPAAASRARRRIPAIDGFDNLLIYCPAANGARYLVPMDPSVPFGYVPPALRGGLALRLASPGSVLKRVPRVIPGSVDTRSLRLSVALSAGGAARVTARERLVGHAAQQWRKALRKIPPGRLRSVFEQQFLGIQFPGASLTTLEIAGRAGGALPLELRFSYDTKSLCRRSGEDLVCRTEHYSPQLRRLYTRLARRQTPLQLGVHVPTTVVMEVTPPAGYKLVAGPRPVRIKTPFGWLRRKITRSSRAAVVRTDFRITQMRVTPKDYDRFVRFAAAVDSPFQDELRFRRISRPPGDPAQKPPIAPKGP